MSRNVERHRSPVSRNELGSNVAGHHAQGARLRTRRAESPSRGRAARRAAARPGPGGRRRRHRRSPPSHAGRGPPRRRAPAAMLPASASGVRHAGVAPGDHLRVGRARGGQHARRVHGPRSPEELVGPPSLVAALERDPSVDRQQLGAVELRPRPEPAQGDVRVLGRGPRHRCARCGPWPGRRGPPSRDAGSRAPARAATACSERSAARSSSSSGSAVSADVASANARFRRSPIARHPTTASSHDAIGLLDSSGEQEGRASGCTRSRRAAACSASSRIKALPRSP